LESTMTMDQLYQLCLSYKHQKVRIHTKHGTMHEGTVIEVDITHIYLIVPASAVSDNRPYPYYGGFYPSYNPYYSNVILPLALFDLLAIGLLL
jgi:hypothetical protein